MNDHSELFNPFAPVIWQPTTIKSAIELKNQLGTKAQFISGGTLLQIRWEAGQNMPQNLISLEKIPSLNTIDLNMETKILSIGALTTLAKCRFESLFENTYPILCKAAQSIAAPAVRNRGTIGGNIMGGVGDFIPLLLALEAKLVFQDIDKIQTIDLWNWLQIPPRSDEQLLTKILLPVEEMSNQSGQFFRKIGRRESFTVAIVTVSGKLKWDDDGVIRQIKLAVGGGENKPMRLERVEQFILGKKVTEIEWRAVYKIICEEFVPVEDIFTTAHYRKKVAANLIVAELLSTIKSGGVREEHYYEI